MFKTSRRGLLKAGGLAAVTGLGGCATATGINPLIPPVSKVIQSPDQVHSTAAAMGEVAQSRCPLAQD